MVRGLRPTCADVRAKLPLFPSLDLDRAVDAVVRAHLLDCVACRRELRGFMDAGEALRAATGAEVPPAGETAPDEAFFVSLEQRILGATTMQQEPVSARAASVRLRRAVVAAAVMFGLGLWLATVLVPHGARDSLLDSSPIVAGEDFPFVPLDGTRLVGRRTWTGLKGRWLADRLLVAPGDDEPAVLTRDLSLRSKGPSFGGARESAVVDRPGR